MSRFEKGVSVKKFGKALTDSTIVLKYCSLNELVESILFLKRTIFPSTTTQSIPAETLGCAGSRYCRFVARSLVYFSFFYLAFIFLDESIYHAGIYMTVAYLGIVLTQNAIARVNQNG